MCGLKVEVGPRSGRSQSFRREWISSKVGRRWGSSVQDSTIKEYMRGGQRSGHGRSWRERMMSITSGFW